MLFKYLTIHCSATPPKMDIGADEIREWHKAKKWRDIGYHLVIRRDGTLEPGRPMSMKGAHVYGHNESNLGLCLIGGVDEYGNPENNFTDEQFDQLRVTISDMCGMHMIKEDNIMGHRDWGANKACPSFDVKEWLERNK